MLEAEGVGQFWRSPPSPTESPCASETDLWGGTPGVALKPYMQQTAAIMPQWELVGYVM